MTDREARLMLSPDDVPLIQMLLADNGGTVVNAETWNVVKKSLPILFNQRAILTAEIERMRSEVETAGITIIRLTNALAIERQRSDAAIVGPWKAT